MTTCNFKSGWFGWLKVDGLMKVFLSQQILRLAAKLKQIWVDV